MSSPTVPSALQAMLASPQRHLRKKQSIKNIKIDEFLLRTPASSSSIIASSPSTSSTESPTGVSDFRLTQPKKNVRFLNGGLPTDHIANDLCVSSEMSSTEKNELWWQNYDFHVFKKTAKMVAAELRRRQSVESSPSTSYGSIIERTYTVCCQTAEELNDVCPLGERDRQVLETWSERGVSRRGLERYTFPALTKERQRRKEIAVRGVIEVQDLFFKGMNLDEAIAADFMRKSSEQLSRSARLFARALGEADKAAAAVHESTVSRAA